MIDFDPSLLPSEKDNYDVWCERCQRVHKHFTFTREKYDQIIAMAWQRVAELTREGTALRRQLQALRDELRGKP